MFVLTEWSRDKFYFLPALQLLKASLPHIVLIVVNLTYVAAGSFMFIALEKSTELEMIANKTRTLEQIYGNVVNATYSTCFMEPLDHEEFKNHLEDRLRHLSLFHEQTPIVLSPLLTNGSIDDVAQWEWKAIVYSLTIITATGFSELSATTQWGKILSVIYGLIGIPLMFLTAADVGKLLSEVVTNCWARLSQKINQIDCCSNSTEETIKHPRRGTAETLRRIRVHQQSTSRRRQSYLYHNMPLEVPGWLIIVLSLGYIAFASAIFMQFRGWKYIASIHFAFDAMTSITLGYTPVDTIYYLLWIVTFCIFGLSVITMSLDLARLKLRNLFIRIHYFGVKLGEKLLAQDDVDPEVALLADAIREMREMGFDSIDISALMELWMKKKEDQANLERMLAEAYKPSDLEKIPLIDQRFRKTSGLRSPSLASAEEIEDDYWF